jgi:predicted solute-binding protein
MASAQRVLAAAVRARPSPLHIKKALASKWYKALFLPAIFASTVATSDSLYNSDEPSSPLFQY